MSRDRLDELLDDLRRRGGRVTSARRLVLAQLADDPKAHISAEELAERLQGDHPELHLATVYRTLRTLSDLGLVQHVHLGHGPAVYHLAEHHHGHVQCSECGRVFGLDHGVVDRLRNDLLIAHGFEIDDLHFALTGRCEACRSAKQDR
ncbi:MAG: transcriptional repressor [Candidatus Microthrix parvicella]|uniref:Putative Fe2+/Zn2+ uptake regulation protein n=1 Tax=Candidatus Neomicrothrix parvicella RN1 TaxID=1229780 RepID=R4YVH1_9ACTN|nr:transcriptional repressor [Candidatus Microthrix parvicella]CCM61864.1 putative Fe2+/Zn2+ uptake regulation protein [Candidatus Microthrix parvicella RN1]